MFYLFFVDYCFFSQCGFLLRHNCLIYFSIQKGFIRISKSHEKLSAMIYWWYTISSFVIYNHKCSTTRVYDTWQNIILKWDFAVNSPAFVQQQKPNCTVTHSHSPHIYGLSVESPERTEKQRGGERSIVIDHYRDEFTATHFLGFLSLSCRNVRHPHKPPGPFAIPH